MDAKQTAIAFHDWVLLNEYFHNNFEQRTYTTEELFDIFINEIKQPPCNTNTAYTTSSKSST